MDDPNPKKAAARLDPTQDEIEAEWADEMEARAAEYESGEVSADDWQESLERIRLHFQEWRDRRR
jgi:hypothetical protein